MTKLLKESIKGHLNTGMTKVLSELSVCLTTDQTVNTTLLGGLTITDLPENNHSKLKPN